MADAFRVLYTTGETGSAESVTAAIEQGIEGADVTVASGASAGVDRLRTDTFECVVSEYGLPGEDGLEFLRTVREDDGNLPFVLYTAQGDEAVAAAAISADVSEYVQKADGADRHAALVRAVEQATEATERAAEPTKRHYRLEQILTTVPECVAELDGDGQFIYANRRAEAVLGLDRAEVTDRAYNDPEWEIRDLDGNPIPDEQLPFFQVYSTGEPLYDYQHSIHWPDGSEKILSVNGAPLFDDRGDVASVVFSLSDITDKKQRERGLKRYRQIVEHVDDIATVINPDGTITDVSPAVERVLGYEPDELIGTNGFRYQGTETGDAVADAIERVLDEPTEPATVRTKFQRADGSWSWIESTLRNRVHDEVIDGILVSSRDVTEQHEQSQRLQRRKQQLNQLHGVTRSLLDSRTPRKVAATASESAVEILGFEFNGIHFHDEEAGGLAPVAVSDVTREVLGDVPVIDSGIAWEAFQAGEERLYDDLDEASEVYDPESTVQSEMALPLGSHGVFIIAATEVEAFAETEVELARVLAANTEAALDRISKEQQLRTREVEIEKKNDRLEEFASIVSHDLRNPLNVARTRAELLAEDCHSEHLAPIERSLDRMEELIADTLTLARQGSAVMEAEPIRLRELVGECWRTVSTDDATLEVVDELTVVGDRSRLRYVFENLFRNAVEHGGEAVTVRIGRTSESGLYVEDSGPGIPAENREAVFDPGQTSEVGGVGFGLTIVRRIAKAHGWEVEAVSGEDGGARFEFTGADVDGS